MQRKLTEKTSLEQRIRTRLAEKNMTIKDLAKSIGMSRVAIYHFFKGNYSRDMLTRVSQVLGIPPYVLLTPLEQKMPAETDQLVEAYGKAKPAVRYAVDVLLNLRTKPLVRRPLVIVVDDLEDNVDLLQRTLRKDFDVLAFSDPHEALKAIREKVVDAVISDQRMPGMTGTQLLSEIDSQGRHIVKMIVSAYSDTPALIEAINQAKVDAFITKPFKPQALRDQLHQLLEVPDSVENPLH